MLKKTLLLTSALASAALMSTASLAELKISATQEWEYSLASRTPSAVNNTLLGSQTDIKLSGDGDLGGGAKYALSYSFSDGAQDALQANLALGGFDVELGQDGSIGIEDVKAIVPFVNNRVNDVAEANTISFDPTDLSSGKSYIGANFAAGNVGKISVGYNPNMGNNDLTDTDKGVAGGTAAATDTYTSARITGSATTASFSGSLGVDGLNVGIGYMGGNNDSTLNDDLESITYGASYNFGKIAIGYQRIENTAGVAKTATEEYLVDNYGISFAASDSISIGLYRSDSTKKVEGAKSGSEMETTLLQVGYKLGAAKLSYDYVKSDDYQFNATQELELHKVKLMMAF